MRYIMISALLIISAMTMQAGDTLTIAKTAYRITYQSKAVNDTLTKPYKYRKDEMRLDISADGISKFYSQSVALREQLMNEKIKKNDFNMMELPKAGILSWKFYKNYPEADKTLMLDRVGTTDCQIEEKMETPEWTMVPDSTAEIMGYPCQMAISNFKGRQWIAWFTEDIPIDEGPWKLRGLPGLVLKAYDSSRQFIFDGAGLEQTDDPITFVKMKREKLTQKDFRRMKASYDPNDQLRGISGQIIIVGSDGKKLDKIPQAKYNLIEQE